MNIEEFFEQEKGITVDSARTAGARYTAIDICRFAKKYHDSEVKNLSLSAVSQRSELFFAFLKWAKQADLDYPDEMLLKDFEQFNAKNSG